MAEGIKAIDTGLPAPDIARRDPFALRGLVVLSLVVAWSFSLSNSGGRLSDIWARQASAGDPDRLRIDAWVTPPAHTGMAPVYLTARRAEPGDIKVPQFSLLTIRISGTDAAVRFTPKAGNRAVELAPDAPKDDENAATAKEPVTTYRLKLIRNGTVSIDGSDYSFALINDTPPKIAFAKEPGRALNGALEIAFTATDDYGVTEAHAAIEPVDADPSALPLFDLPAFRLDTPGGGAKDIKSTVSRDLTEHPLSGKKVRLTLVARDAAGLEGRSETKVIVLPSRFFNEALAGSIAEQRQVFSLDVNQIPRALVLNEAAALRPEESIPKLDQYLLLQSAKNRLKFSASLSDLKDTAAYFWDVARYIEDGDLSAAEKRLRNAQDALTDALNRNASDAEIAKLMQELREAMKDYLTEMAKRMGNPDTSRMAS
jgi:uncharacterized protein (TIGR02302 family)